MENDWSTTAAGQFLMALDYGWDVLGLVGDTANTWALQSSLHALALLEVGNLSCIPVYKGADYPLLVTPKIMTAYQNLMGPFPWKGVFAEYNETAESLGSEATGGVPHSSPAALYEGYPNTTVAGNYSAAWMIEQVHTYPGEIVFYSGGALTNLALAVRMDPEFAALTKGLYIMGGFADNNLLMTSGDLDQADINTDFNFKADPEATKIVLTAAFPNITLVSNAANAYFADTAYLEEAYEIQTPYTKLARDYSETYLPLWDEITTMVMLDPSAILNQTSFYVNVDTSFYSPTYGNIWAYQDILKPSLQDLREVNFVYSTNETMLRTTLKRALQYPKSCS
ncbi:Inosine/uridine-preferring nucleoside hydrolase domain-containing protein [Pseudomassariella vexata]|uniref:Inosine/uridine-preferring nucleoside hydrolase domain-containing protein n=1 Tax=Pseudomassariella vexata TaxID=1141098 RepID=A0A1Y2E0X7_9PEZI|nr:Inosine/uridine-preferring nucleoside hydrolase domain-containing protein [Pseudomassariella vexata]ORY65192.1 Inosine/uridine-preferring nucleoside hydrolase domain-containing protein [Pseudomassariella vexata]